MIEFSDNSLFTGGLQSSVPVAGVALDNLVHQPGATVDEFVGSKKKEEQKTALSAQPKFQEGRDQADIDKFILVHKHVPTPRCGGSFASPCRYFRDLEPLNPYEKTDDELEQDPSYVEKKAYLDAKTNEAA